MIKTDRKKMLIALTSAVLASLVITAAASSSVLYTPLYTSRMEQQSSEMHFLPTSMSVLAYTTEKGCIVNYNFVGGCCNSVEPFVDTAVTCDDPTCPATCKTCQTCHTCPNTCNTCPATCPSTCPLTCWPECWPTFAWPSCQGC